MVAAIGTLLYCNSDKCTVSIQRHVSTPVSYPLLIISDLRHCNSIVLAALLYINNDAHPTTKETL